MGGGMKNEKKETTIRFIKNIQITRDHFVYLFRTFQKKLKSHTHNVAVLTFKKRRTDVHNV